MEPRAKGCTVDWLAVSKERVQHFRDIAVEASEKGSANPLWVIHATFDGDLIPGQLDVNTFVASVPYAGKARIVTDFQLACRDPETLRWVNGYDGFVPENAIAGGKIKCTGEKLFVGRGVYEGRIIPGKVQASHKVLYICYNGDEVKLDQYEVLCRRGGC